MALPLAPLAVTALRFGTLALVAYAATRKVSMCRTDQKTEDILDQVPEGLSAHRPHDREQYNATARFRRVVRFGVDGPGVEFDITALGRVKFRKV